MGPHLAFEKYKSRISLTSTGLCVMEGSQRQSLEWLCFEGFLQTIILPERLRPIPSSSVATDPKNCCRWHQGEKEGYSLT